MDRISILIPTMNRPEFMDRVFKYYSNVGFNGTILVADSSEDNATERLVPEHKSLNIVYHHYPKEIFKNEVVAMQAVMAYARTPYTVFQGDDDFIALDGVKTAADFLDDNADFVMAGGGQLRFTVQNGIFNIDAVKLPIDYSSDDFIERFKTYMRAGSSTMYFLHRTSVMNDILQYAEEVTLPAIGTEILLCSLAILSGRCKSFPLISSFQQGEHAKTIFPRTNKKLEMPTFYKVMLRDDWPEQFRTFKQIIVNKMVDLGEDYEHAEHTFDSEMVYRTIVLLDAQLKTNYEFLMPDLQRWNAYQQVFGRQISMDLPSSGTLEELLRPVLEVT